MFVIASPIVILATVIYSKCKHVHNTMIEYKGENVVK